MLDRAKPVTDQISNTMSQAGQKAVPVMAATANKIIEVGKADAPNYKVAAAATLLFAANTMLSSYQGNYYTSWFNTFCTLGSAMTFANQYLASEACPSVVKNTMSFFKEKVNSVVGVSEEPKPAIENKEPGLRTRTRLGAA